VTHGGWIVIPNWDKFQHYKDRNPTWIKVHVELVDKPEWRELPDRRKGILVSLWLLYAASNGRVPASPSYLNRAFGFKTEWEVRRGRERGEAVVSGGREQGESVVRTRDLKALEQAEFIKVVASKPLALRARSREELSKESSKEAASATTENGRASSPEEKNSRPFVCPNCGIGFKTEHRLLDHRDLVHEP